MKKLPLFLSLFLGLFFLGCQKDNPTQETLTPERPALKMDNFDTHSIKPDRHQVGELTSRSRGLVTHAPVYGFVDPDAPSIVGSSTLQRKSDRLTMRLSEVGLPPGHVATVWWVVWNNPEFCHTTPCDDTDFANPLVNVDVLYAAGAIVNERGRPHGRMPLTRFSGELSPGETSGSIYPLLLGIPGIGVIDPLTAEVHLVVRTHGPKLPGQEVEQMTTFLGGCSTELPSFGVVPNEPGVCADVFAAIHVAP